MIASKHSPLLISCAAVTAIVWTDITADAESTRNVSTIKANYLGTDGIGTVCSSFANLFFAVQLHLDFHPKKASSKRSADLPLKFNASSLKQQYGHKLPTRDFPLLPDG